MRAPAASVSSRFICRPSSGKMRIVAILVREPSELFLGLRGRRRREESGAARSLGYYLAVDLDRCAADAFERRHA